MNLKLVEASLEYKDLVIDMLLEWRSYNDSHPGANRSPSAIFHGFHDYDEYLYLMNVASKEVKREGYVPSTQFFLLDVDRNIMVGACSIRHYLNETLRNGGGHIGDGIRPSERGKGYGTQLVKLALFEAKKLGIKEVMMSANKDNIASQKTIINNGGVFDKEVLSKGEILNNYWISL